MFTDLLPTYPGAPLKLWGAEAVNPPRNEGAEWPEKPPRGAERWAQIGTVRPATNSANMGRRFIELVYACLPDGIGYGELSYRTAKLALCDTNAIRFLLLSKYLERIAKAYGEDRKERGVAEVIV